MRTILLMLLAVTAPVSSGRLAQYMNVFGVTLEQDTLDDAVKRLGPARIQFNHGDAHAGEYAICYQGDDGTTLAFSSHAEMGGSDHAITSLQIVARASLADYSGDEGYTVPPEGKPVCSRLAKLNRSLVLGGDLRLGATRKQVAKSLGARPDGPGPISVSALIPVGDGLDASRAVEVTFESGRAVAISASQITSD